MNMITNNKYAKYLNYSKNYAQLPNKYILENTNGCGSGWTAKLIPDRFFSINFKICCRIHDLDYKLSNSKKWADKRLRRNMKAIAKAYYKEEAKRLNISWWQVWKWDDLLDADLQKKSVFTFADFFYRMVVLFGDEPWRDAQTEQQLG